MSTPPLPPAHLRAARLCSLGLALVMLAASLLADLAVRAAGPAALVKDINTSKVSDQRSRPQNGRVIDGIAYFSATDTRNGVELWRSDGTEAGTSLLKDIWPGTESSTWSANGHDGIVLGDTLFFYSQ